MESVVQNSQGRPSGVLKSQSDVVRLLNDRGVHSGKKAKHDTVKRMLQNPLYAGYLEYKPWGVSFRKAEHPALISLATYRKIQERLKEGAYTITRKDMRDDFPLRGFVACRCCGKRVSASFSTNKAGKKIPYYRCARKDCEIGSKSLPAGILHERFEKTLEGMSIKDEAVEYIKAVIMKMFEDGVERKEAELATREKDAEEIDAKIETLVELTCLNSMDHSLLENGSQIFVF